MRDVNNGWLVRYLHSNTASAFFFLVYLHIGRGVYYGSYRAPRTLVWTIGTVIFILMMARNKWPNWISDWWADEIKAQVLPSVRFNIEQSVNNSAYIHNLSMILFKYGYCSSFVPKLVKKSEGVNDKRLNKGVTRFNYRLTLFTFTSLHWIYEVNDVTVKRVPEWIGEYITPIGLAHWIMQDGSRQQKQGISLATHSFSEENCIFLAKTLEVKYALKTSVVKTGFDNQWRISVKKESMEKLVSIVSKHIVPEMQYKIKL